MEDLRYNCSRYFKDYYCSISINQFKKMKVESLIFITHLEQELIRESNAKSLSNHNSLEHSNLEEQIAFWLDSHGVNDGWKPPQTSGSKIRYSRSRHYFQRGTFKSLPDILS